MRIVLHKIIEGGGGLALRQVSQVAFKSRVMAGSVRILPQPETGRFAFVYASADGSSGWLDVWSSSPLKRLGSVPLAAAIRVDWLPSRSSLAIVERSSRGMETRVVSIDGSSLKIPGCLAVFGDSEGKGGYTIMLSEDGTGDTDLGRMLQKGIIRFERFGRTVRERSRVPTGKAVTALLGDGGGVEAVRRLLDPYRRPIGFARNWALIGEGDLKASPGAYNRRTYDQLGFPRRKAIFTRREIGDVNSTHAVSKEGALLFSGGGNADDRGEIRDGRWLAARVSRTGTQRWLIPVHPVVRGFVLWK